MKSVTDMNRWMTELLIEGRMHEVGSYRGSPFLTHLLHLPFCYKLVRRGYFVRASWYSIFAFRLTYMGRLTANSLIWGEVTDV